MYKSAISLLLGGLVFLTACQNTPLPEPENIDSPDPASYESPTREEPISETADVITLEPQEQEFLDSLVGFQQQWGEYRSFRDFLFEWEDAIPFQVFIHEQLLLESWTRLSEGQGLEHTALGRTGLDRAIAPADTLWSDFDLLTFAGWDVTLRSPDPLGYPNTGETNPFIVITEYFTPVALGSGYWSLSNFEEIQEGMEWKLIDTLLGGNGELITEDDITTVYRWTGNQGQAAITVTFENERVVAAEYEGLENHG